jgi:hypothetical protein
MQASAHQTPPISAHTVQWVLPHRLKGKKVPEGGKSGIGHGGRGKDGPGGTQRTAAGRVVRGAGVLGTRVQLSGLLHGVLDEAPAEPGATRTP